MQFEKKILLIIYAGFESISKSVTDNLKDASNATKKKLSLFAVMATN